MPGTQGQVHALQVKFTEDGVLFDPFQVQNVNIYDVAVGGSPVATLVPTQVSTGVYRIEWSIPFNQTPGTYYDEWTWVALSGKAPKVQRYEFQVLEDQAAASRVKIPKLKNAKRAVGYWGRDPFKRVNAEQTPEKIRVLLQDKLLSRGKDVYFWQQVIESNPLALECSCVKDTTDRADATCSSCYGSRFMPGYVRLFHENLFLSSISSGLVLSNVILDKTIKPHRLLLDDTSLTGTIDSAAIPYSNNLELNWEFKSDQALILNTNTITTEFSTDALNYFPIAEINDVGKKPIGIGNIYLRITLTRNDLLERSPEFEIIRLRHAEKVDPYLKILRPQISEFPSWMQYGRRSEQLGERFWTLPLDFFDQNVNQDTEAAKIVENSFYELVKGINTGIRYVTTKLNYNEEFGIFTQQSFESRRTQPEEFYNRLVF